MIYYDAFHSKILIFHSKPLNKQRVIPQRCPRNVAAHNWSAGGRRDDVDFANSSFGSNVSWIFSGAERREWDGMGE